MRDVGTGGREVPPEVKAEAVAIVRAVLAGEKVERNRLRQLADKVPIPHGGSK